MPPEVLDEHYAYLLLHVFDEKMAENIKLFWGTNDFNEYVSNLLLRYDNKACDISSHVWISLNSLKNLHDDKFPELARKRELYEY